MALLGHRISSPYDELCRFCSSDCLTVCVAFVLCGRHNARHQQWLKLVFRPTICYYWKKKCKKCCVLVRLYQSKPHGRSVASTWRDKSRFAHVSIHSIFAGAIASTSHSVSHDPQNSNGPNNILIQQSAQPSWVLRVLRAQGFVTSDSETQNDEWEFLWAWPAM